MSDTNNSKASFGKKASLSFGKTTPPKTQIVIASKGIAIRVSHISGARVSGHTKIDFENKKKRDSYKELNRKLGEG